MRFPFNPNRGLVIVTARIEGPVGETYAQLALDTGATMTSINTAKLVSVGYDPAISQDRVNITTGSGIEYVPRLTVSKFTALGQERNGFLLLCHTLPPSAGIDGVLGLNFIRRQRLVVDFRTGRVTLG